MTDAVDTTRAFLEDLQRFELSTLLSVCSIALRDDVGPRQIDDWFPRVREKVPVVLAPTPVDDAIRALPEHDQKRIAEAIARVYNSK